MDTLVGELKQHRIVGDDFWSIATLRSGAGELHPVVGKLLGAHVGDTVELCGHWSTHPRFGRQFKVTSCLVTVPQTENGVVAWLTMRLPNVGEARARAMLAHCGGPSRLWDVLDDAPHELEQIDGITARRAQEIKETYVRFRQERDAMIRFRSFGMTENQIARMLAAWGEHAEAHLAENPYRLIQDVDGFGFLRADAIAQRMGIPQDHVGRIEHGLIHVMQEAAGHGHCYVPRAKLIRIASQKVLRIEETKVVARLEEMKKSLKRQRDRIFMKHLHRSESRCAQKIKRLLARPTSREPARGSIHE